MSNGDINRLQEDFNDLAEACQKFCYFTRDESFQREAADKLEQYAVDTKAKKREVAAAGQEDMANAMLAIEHMSIALASELRMWVLLKTSDPDGAWNMLVSAQDNTRCAMQAHPIAGHLDNYVNRLAAIEKMIFPHQVFSSSGLVVKSSKCSICGSQYGECRHVKGRCYNGEMCVRICEDIEIREISIVEDPADKRCRVFNAPLDGVMRNVMTWLPVSESESEDATASEPSNSDEDLGIDDEQISEATS